MSLASAACRVFSLLLMAASFAIASTGLASAEPTAVELGEGLWIDDVGQRVYLSNPQGFPEARDLKDGRLLWAGQEPALLLASLGGRWLALGQSGRRGEGRLLLIEAASGAVQQRIDFPLPDAVSAAVSAEPLRRFDVRAERSGDGVRLHWSYVAHPLRGALLASDGGAVASEGVELQGALEVDLGQSPPTVRALDASSSPWASRSTPDISTEERVAALGARQFRSADNSHAMAPEPRPDAAFGTVWRWRLASRSEGLLESTLDLPFAYAPYLLSGERLIYRAPPMGHLQPTGAWRQEGPRLVVHLLADGREAWGIELLEREFQGVLPP